MLPDSRSSADEPIPGGWTERAVTVGPHTFRLLTPADPDRLLETLIAGDPAVASRPHLADPYWAKLWPAARHLAKAIVAEHGTSDRRYSTALELGCGSGLAGIAALACGIDVTFSDYVPFTVQLAVENAARNGFPGVRGIVLDWRDPPGEKFPLILAADVTYDRANIGPLLDTCQRMLAPEGEVRLADGGRSPVADFLCQAAGRGWQVTLLDEAGGPTSEPVLGRCQTIVLRRR